MGKMLNLQGQVYGKLTVLREAGRTKWGAVLWECKCECGKLKVVKANHLRTGGTKTCGCHLGRDYQRVGRNHQEGIGRITLSDNTTLPVGWSEVVMDYKVGAKRRGYKWELSIDEAYALLAGDCHYCGASPQNSRLVDRSKTRRIIYGGIDRKNPRLGYNTNNCVPCCARCNMIKRAMTYKEFLDFIKAVHQHLIAPKE